MPVRTAAVSELPWLLPGHTVTLPGRGEMFVRHHRHEDASRPTVLLLHGWTASCDTQFFTAYRELAEAYSVIGVDHRGHGRGLRPNRAFSLEDCADDAAAVVRALGTDRVITLGYSMGGPVSFMVQQRHPDLVEGMVFQATSMEWNGTRKERAQWRVSHYLAPLFRRLATPRTIRWGVRRSIPRGHELSRYVDWLVGEIRRNDIWMVTEAGRAISSFDARPFAARIQVPTAMLVTQRDRLVHPTKQYALATTVRAEIVELDGDHIAPLEQPREYSAATRRAVDSVARRAR